MDVILLENIRKLGALGAHVKVKSGFARNFLIPQGMAVYATKENIEKFEKRRAELEKVAAKKHAEAVARQQAIQQTPAITIQVKAGDEGKLFGSIGARDVIEALQKVGVVVEKREIQLPEGSIRHVGEYDITIELQSDVTATVKLIVAAQG